MAVDAVHDVAFHQGLGENITPSAHFPYEKNLSSEAVAEYARNAYAKSNVALVGSGISSSELSKWVGDFFNTLPNAGASGQYQLKSGSSTNYYGGEQRTSTKAGNSVVIAFPGSGAFGTSAYKPAASVLAALLGGESSIKWTPGFSLLSQATQGFNKLRVSTKNYTYSDAGLLAVNLSGKADQVASAGKSVVEALKKVAAGEVAVDEIKKASAFAKFSALESAQTLATGLEVTGSGLINGSKPYQISEVAQGIDSVTEAQVKDVSLFRSHTCAQENSSLTSLSQLAKTLVSGKASVASVGDLSQLPYASDLGLTV